jgi:hypothetical protein
MESRSVGPRSINADARADAAANGSSVESIVHHPASWLVLTAGLIFVGGGIFIYVGASRQFSPPWPGAVFAACFGGLGAIALLAGLNSILLPKRIRHAPLSSLPGVPTGPVVCEYAAFSGWVRYELESTEGGWELRPSARQWREMRWLWIGFGIFCFLGGMAFLSRIFHDRGEFGWPGAIVLATIAAYVIVGVTWGLIAEMTRAERRRMTTLTYCEARKELMLETPRFRSSKQDEPAFSGAWTVASEGKRQRLVIPRQLVAAVQLCPWKYRVSSHSEESSSWAVQGVLVLKLQPHRGFERVPMLVTNDYVGAARLMQRAAERLDVPFLFCADADGWAAEDARADDRASRKTGSKSH